MRISHPLVYPISNKKIDFTPRCPTISLPLIVKRRKTPSHNPSDTSEILVSKVINGEFQQNIDIKAASSSQVHQLVPIGTTDLDSATITEASQKTYPKVRTSESQENSAPINEKE